MTRAPLRRVRKGSHERKALDDLCRRIVFARDGNKCQKYGTRQNLQWAHVHSRRYQSSRWRLENSLVLSGKAHLEWHLRPLESVAWFRAKFPERAKVLDMIAQFPQKVDLELEKLYLLAMAQKFGVDPALVKGVRYDKCEREPRLPAPLPASLFLAPLRGNLSGSGAGPLP